MMKDCEMVAKMKTTQPLVKRAAWLGLGAMLFGSGQALASPIFPFWDFRVEAGFTTFAGEGASSSSSIVGEDLTSGLVDPDDTSQPFDADDDWQTISWGPTDGAPRSSIGVELGDGSGTNFVGQLQTGGPLVTTGNVFHQNNVLPGNGVTLDTASLVTQIFIVPRLAAGSPVAPPDSALEDTISLSINFEETSNNNSCVAGSSTNCDDVFVVNVKDEAFNRSTGLIERLISVGGNDYIASVKIEGLGELGTDACAEAEVTIEPGEPTCIGLLTGEGQSNVFTTSVGIRAVPAPGTLALLGLGLLALARRRRS
ncbi:MAG: THxN family PEP-CTERM protein [Pseudohaliea sp.]